MKQKINLLLTALAFMLFVAGTAAQAEEKTKNYNEQWPVNEVQTLHVNNRFGNVNITHKGGKFVTIDVTVTVEASSERRALDLLDLIDVRFTKTGNTVTATTSMGRNFNSRHRFSIDYEINIPPDRNLKVENKYGNTFINELSANGSIDIQYGNLTVNDLNTAKGNSVDLRLAYSKSDIYNAQDLSVTVQYSKMNIATMNNLQLDSKYNVINIDRAGSISADSRYDTFNFSRILSLDADTKYTNISIDELQEALNLEAGYGGVNIREVNSNFESIRVSSNYGQIVLGLGGADYALDANCEYCGVSFPDGRFSGDRISENNKRTIRGKVGNGTGGSVVITSRYGEIKLN